MVGDVGDQDRVAQVRLVGAVFQHRFADRGCAGTAPAGVTALAVGELLEHAGEHRLDRRENIVLRDEAHFEIELVEFAGRAVGAGVLVAEAGRDLEIAVEAGDHDQLLEHLRRLRERVEFAGMDAARHQIVARALGAGGGQDRRLELGEALLDHPPADRADHLAAQQDVGVQPLAAQVEIAVAEADILRIIGLAGDRQRQLLGGGLDGDRCRRRPRSRRSAGSGLAASAPRATTSPSTVTTDSARRCSSVASGSLSARRRRSGSARNGRAGRRTARRHGRACGGPSPTA